MKILVTGSAGFIGFHVVEKLIELNFQVIGIDNINDYYDSGLKFARLEQSGVYKISIEYGKPVQSKIHKNYTFIRLEIEDSANINRLFSEQKFDYVCHLAAQAGVRYSIENPEVYIRSNINGFFNVIEASKNNGVKHFIYAGSSSVYGLNTEMPFKTTHHTDHPAGLYAATKKSNELIAHSYSHVFKLPTTGLRFFTVYGPWGRPDMALFLFTKAIFEGSEIKVYNNGNMLRDFTYVDDIVEGISFVIEKIPKGNDNWNSEKPDSSNSSAPYKLYNIGNNLPVKLEDFISAIEKATGKKADKKYLPMQAGDIQSTFADVSDLIHDFNYKPNTKLETGVRNFVEWYKQYYNV